MKKFLKIFVVLIAFGFSGCEKDDICADTTPTTPRIVLEFFNKDNPEVNRNLSNLAAIAEGESAGIIFDGALTANPVTKFYTNANKIYLPLRLNAETTKFALTLNADLPASNTDTLTFNYSTRQLYVSRACGYKTNFRLNSENAVVRPDNDTDEWINNFIIETNLIETENETHIKVYF